MIRVPGAWDNSRALRASLVTLAAAALLAGWSAAVALRGGGASDEAPRDLLHPPVGLAASPAPERAALDDDPFAPDRRPRTRYRLPGSAEEEAPAPQPVLPEVLGTVIATDGDNLATIRLGADSTKILRVGQSIGGYTVREIVRGQVTFTSASGERIVIRAVSPFPRS